MVDNSVCPNCGYCPHCGRARQAALYNPYNQYSPWGVPCYGTYSYVNDDNTTTSTYTGDTSCRGSYTQ